MTNTNNQGLLEQLVIFELYKQTFGVNITSVQEIIKMVPITHVPKTPSYIKGVINLRGKIIPVLDLYQRLGLSKSDHNSDWRIVILESGEIVVGILVDGVSEVISIDANEIENVTELAMGLESRFIRGIGKRNEDLIIILNLEQVLSIMDKSEDLSVKVG